MFATNRDNNAFFKTLDQPNGLATNAPAKYQGIKVSMFVAATHDSLRWDPRDPKECR